MKTLAKSAIYLVALGLFAAMILSGCNIPLTAGDVTAEAPPPAVEVVESKQPDDTQEVYETANVLAPSAPGFAVEMNEKAIIDYSNTREGYVMAKFLEEPGRKIKLLLTVPDETLYTYSLHPGIFEAFPLSGGNGEYTVAVYEQVEGTKYALVVSATIIVTLADEFAPFLRPNQYVDFNKDSEVVSKAAMLTAGMDDMMEKITEVYNFVITNIEYDVDLAESVESGYLPVLDQVLQSGKGICFDYAALMTAMLRSQSIPTKLVIGFTADAYHAWISVFSEETGWVDDLIYFDGNDWKLMDLTFAAGGQSNDILEYIGDGTNYEAKFMH